MSSISNISNVSNLSSIQPSYGNSQRIGAGDSDGDGNGSGGAARIGRSNFMTAIQQALGQNVQDPSATSSSGSTSGTDPTSSPADPQAALQAFLQNLFAALGQTGGSQTGGSDADGDADGGKAVSGIGRHGSNMSANIQNLLQQLNASSQNSSANGNDPLGNLNSSFQNLMGALNASQGQKAAGATAPTLQAFLQNLYQDMGSGQTISGALVNATA